MKLLDPKIKHDDIELQINDDQEAYDSVTENWGRMIPMVKINDYTLDPAEVRSYEFSTNINNVPTFTLIVDDTQFNIRQTLEREYMDLATIFIGHRDWYHKITGLITDIYNEANQGEIIISGTLYIPKLYDSKQDGFVDEIIQDIVYKKCDESDIGLYVIDNDKLSKTVDSIQSDVRQIEYIDDLLTQHTDNLWCIDNFYYLHIGNIESIREQEISTFNFKDGTILDEPKPIKLVSNPFAIDGSIDTNIIEGNDKAYNTFFKIRSYTINTNIGASLINNYLEYTNNSEPNIDGIDTVNLFTQSVNNSVGSGIKTNNTFSGFIERINNDSDTYKSIINKTLNDKTINVIMEEPLYEITPFMNVDIELVLPFNPDLKENYTDVKIDKENSGKRTIIGYSMLFDMTANGANPRILQSITLI